MRRIKCWLRGYHHWVKVMGVDWAQECANCEKARKYRLVLR